MHLDDNLTTFRASKKIRYHRVDAGRLPLILIITGLSSFQRSFRITLPAAIIIFAISLSASNASAAINIVCTSGDQFYIDASDNLSGRYVSYQITNTGPANYDDIWVEIGNFTGGVVSLAPNETNLYHLESLTVGATKTAFFYLQASNVTLFPQSHTISVYEGQPPSGTLLTSATFSFLWVGSSISSGSNRITSITVEPIPPVLGGLLTITVDGDGGRLGLRRMMIFSPAGFLDWPASSYVLVSTVVVLSGGINEILQDRLFYTGNANRSFTYHGIYTFRLVSIPPGSAIASPVATISSGSRMMHDHVKAYQIIDPIIPAVNLVLVQKSVLPPNIGGGDTATYTISLLNLGAAAVQIDSVNDILPSSAVIPSYLSGSSRFNALPISDPASSGSQLKWTGPFSVDSGEVATLTFDVSFPAIERPYTNFAFGAIGNTLIDSTLDVNDYAPAAATIMVGIPRIIMLKSAQVISDPVNISVNPKAIPGAILLYTVAVANQGIGMADDNSVIAGDAVPAGTSLYVGDINGFGSGPVVFEDGNPVSGMTYSYGGLGDTSDNLAFSSDSGATYSYVPLPDSSGFDPNVTNISINPDGPFQGAAGGGDPSFTVRFMVRVR
jgi:uncharacterized repeat protein (TIGR01451 family)